MLGSLTFGNINFADYNSVVTDAGIYATASPDFTAYEIAGRNGDLHISNNRQSNVSLTYPAYLLTTKMPEMYFSLRDALMNAQSEEGLATASQPFANKGYLVLRDTFLEDRFRMAKFIKLTPLSHDSGLATFSVSFTCRPEVFLDSGANQVALYGSDTTEGIIINPCSSPSKPLICVTGTGTVTVGSTIAVINESRDNDTVNIDTDTMQAYLDDGTNWNENVSISYGELVSGENTITLDSSINSVTVFPRWSQR